MNPAIEEFRIAVQAKLPEIFYNVVTKEYHIRNPSGQWYSLAEAQIKRVLKSYGMSPHTDANTGLSEIDQHLLMLQQMQSVEYAGPLAGHKAGIHVMEGRRILVTSSPRIIKPCKGEWPLWKSILCGLFVEGEDETQLWYFRGWLKVAYEALAQGIIRTGQAIAMCGPRNSGKSLTQNKLITPILGGRVGKPYQVMIGGTAFNSDLFGAEHLIMEDESPSSDIKTRRNFGAQVKNIAANDVQRLHAKNKEPICVTPLWRLSISLNDEAENLMVLPPLDESLSDKIMLFKTQQQAMPMATASPLERAEFSKRLEAEIPAVIYDLVNMEIPSAIADARFGLKAYHHPLLLAALDSLSPEIRLLTLIDMYIFPTTVPCSGKKIYTAEELEMALKHDESHVRHEARNLLSWNNSCGTYLGRLAKKHPERVRYLRHADKREWELVPPGMPFSPDTKTMTPMTPDLGVQ